MSILIIGGDKINNIRNILSDMGVNKIKHWDARKKASTCKKTIPVDIKCVIMLTNYLNHNTMKRFKTESKKRDIPLVCAKSSASCVYQEYVKIMGIENCKNCYDYEDCHSKELK
jgi:hypothetical protein